MDEFQCPKVKNLPSDIKEKEVRIAHRSHKMFPLPCFLTGEIHLQQVRSRASR